MDARQEAKFTMYRATEQNCDNNAVIIATVAAFASAFAAFKAIIAAIISTTQFKDLSLTGITVDKGNSKQTLCQMAADIAGIIFAFASVTNNNTLKQEVNFKLSKLLKTRDDSLAPRCRIIHDKGIEFLDALKDYGITAAKLAALDAAINTYLAESPKPRTAVSQRKTHQANLRQLFKDADAILKNQMDKLIVNFKADHPDFVKTYESTRIIIDPSTTTTQLKGKITNKSDGSALHNAEITIVEPTKTANSNSLGNYTIKPAPIGKFTIRVSKAGFNDFEVFDFDIKLGDITTLNVELEGN